MEGKSFIGAADIESRSTGDTRKRLAGEKVEVGFCQSR